MNILTTIIDYNTYNDISTINVNESYFVLVLNLVKIFLRLDIFIKRLSKY